LERKLRTFIALDVPQEDVLGEMVSVQTDLAETRADLKMVSRENLHFTVKFLGEISEAQVTEVESRLAALELRRAEVRLRGIGAFPHARRPSVIWTGVAPEDNQKIAPLAEKVITALQGIGQTEERGFQAHITLARVRSGRNREALFAFLEKHADHDFGLVSLESLNFKSSELTPRGPVYSDIRTYKLK
jgi:2'-5' RNA ligase